MTLSEYEACEAKRMGYDPDDLESFDAQTRRMVFKDGTERQGCSVITRVMGYHSETAMFNKGKQAEHVSRKFFTEEKAMEHVEDSDLADVAAIVPEAASALQPD